MWRKVTLTFTALCGVWLSYSVHNILKQSSLLGWDSSAGQLGVVSTWISLFLGALLFMFICFIVSMKISKRVHQGIYMLSGIPMNELIARCIGIAVGLIAALLFYPCLLWLDKPGEVLQVPITLVCVYVGLMVGIAKKEELTSFWMSGRWNNAQHSDERKIKEHKILDTSVIIDGRIADICKTGFIEGTIVIPQFVLEELQHIADSSDLLKRNRGRRGLDILNKIQKELNIHVLIYEGDFEEISEVDSKLIKLAKVLEGKVVTNDFNLNKVCELQGVSVLNINDLANAVKPVVLPGEEIVVQVIKDGKEFGQGVAYLDDGTMIVVEGGRGCMGMMMEVLVTSVLQTSAGRMIFAKPKLLEKAQ